MAECYRYICSDCRRSIDAWSDGNPYYIDEAGQKQHPITLIMNCAQNALEMIPLICALIVERKYSSTHGYQVDTAPIVSLRR